MGNTSEVCVILESPCVVIMNANGGGFPSNVLVLDGTN